MTNPTVMHAPHRGARWGIWRRLLAQPRGKTPSALILALLPVPGDVAATETMAPGRATPEAGGACAIDTSGDGGVGDFLHTFDWWISIPLWSRVRAATALETAALRDHALESMPASA